MTETFEYKVIDYKNINHHSNSDVEEYLSMLGEKSFKFLVLL